MTEQKPQQKWLDEVYQRLNSLKVERDKFADGLIEAVKRKQDAERLCRELAVGLNSLLADQRVHLPVVPGSAGVRCLCCRCNALALLSRPEVVNLLEKREAGRG